MRLPLIFTLLVVQVAAKPIQDVDSLGPRYKQLADSIDGGLKFVEQPVNGKFREEQVDATAEPTPPIIQLLSTVDSKLDEEIDSESSLEEEEQPVLLPTNATAHENVPSDQKLYVEEHENDAAFNDKQELSAKKPMPQILRTVNAVPTDIPETATAPEPTQTEVPTTPMHEETSKSKSKTDFSKQKSAPVNEKQKPTELPPKPTVTQKPTELPVQNFKPAEQEELEEGRQILDENDRRFDGPKQQENHQQGAMIYVQPVPDIHGNSPLATFQPLITTEMPTQETTKEPAVSDDERSWWQTLTDGVACARGACKGVFKVTTTAKPKELKPPTIIRRARHNKDEKETVVVCRCLDQ